MSNYILSKDEIESAVADYYNTKTGRAEIKKRIGKKEFVARYTSDTKYSPNIHYMETLRDDMAKMLIEHMHEETASHTRAGLSGITLSDIAVGKLNKLSPSGDYQCTISFDTNLHRDSLVPDAYPNGIDNIVKLFIRGYSASGSVVGTWHGIDGVHSLRKREPKNFVKNAAIEFNKKYEPLAIADVLNNYES